MRAARCANGGVEWEAKMGRRMPTEALETQLAELRTQLASAQYGIAGEDGGGLRGPQSR